MLKVVAVEGLRASSKNKSRKETKKIPLKEDNKAREVFGSVVMFVF